jgi:hypothetical protein
VSTERTERLVSSVTNELPCGVIMVDISSGLIDFVNPKAVRWLQLEKGQSFVDSLQLSKETVFSLTEFEKLMETVHICSSQSPPDDRQSSQYNEVTLKTLSGRVFSFLCRRSIMNKTPPNTTSSPSSTGGSKKTKKKKGKGVVDSISDAHLTWIVNDITAISNEMEEKQSAIIRFMRCTSHDMRTPMQVRLEGGGYITSHPYIHRPTRCPVFLSKLQSALGLAENISKLSFFFLCFS